MSRRDKQLFFYSKDFLLSVRFIRAWHFICDHCNPGLRISGIVKIQRHYTMYRTCNGIRCESSRSLVERTHLLHVKMFPTGRTSSTVPCLHYFLLANCCSRISRLPFTTRNLAHLSPFDTRNITSNNNGAGTGERQLRISCLPMDRCTARTPTPRPNSSESLKDGRVDTINPHPQQSITAVTTNRHICTSVADKDHISATWLTMARCAVAAEYHTKSPVRTGHESKTLQRMCKDTSLGTVVSQRSAQCYPGDGSGRDGGNRGRMDCTMLEYHPERDKNNKKE